MSINKTFEEELEVAHGKVLREKGKERPVVIIIKKIIPQQVIFLFSYICKYRLGMISG